MATPNIVLALLAGLAQYLQAKQLTPKNMEKTGFAANIGTNMTLIFPILTVAIAARLPAALALYWFTSSLIAVVQQQMVLGDEVKFVQRLKGLRTRKNESSQ